MLIKSVYGSLCDELNINSYSKLPCIEVIYRDDSTLSLSIDGEEVKLPIIRLEKNLKPLVSCIILDTRLGVVAFYNKKDVKFCPTCLSSKVEVYEGYVGSPLEEVALEDIHFIVPVIMDMLHDIPIATGFHETDQNWSVLTPLPSCVACENREKRDRIRSIISVTPDVNLTGSTVSFDLTTDDMLAKYFVSNNRWAIGFGSVIGNVVVEDDVSFPVTYACNFCDTDTIQIASGKGISLDRAIAGCVGEGLERYFLDGSFSKCGHDVSLSTEIGRISKADLYKDFGFPYRDSASPFPSSATENDLIEWSVCEELTASSEIRLIPTNFVYCPYRASSGAKYITMSSTNGAAAGRSLQHATLSALLECVERDAFAYYSRIDAKPVGIVRETWPSYVDDYQRRNPNLKVAVTVLPSPFSGVFVAQVTMQNTTGEAPVTVRGTGASFSEDNAIVRAASECVQMFHSLRDTSDDPNAADDMRDTWRSGNAKDIWPEYFEPTINRNMSAPIKKIPPGDSILQIIEDAKRQGIAIFRHVVYMAENFCVVKCIFTSGCVADASYFDNNHRFSDFAALMDSECGEVVYHGPLFM